VRVRIYIEGLALLQTSESGVSPHLVLFCEPHRTLRNNVAVVFNRVYAVLESVELGEVPWDKTCIWIFLFGARKGVFFFGGCFYLLLSDLFLAFLSYNSDVYQVRIAYEKTFDCVKFIGVLVVKFRERLKFKVSRSCPIESLLGELKFIGISNAHRNVVVVFNAVYAAPEYKLLKVGSL
jgi:hypothetical protein